jgi:adenosine kinase
VPDFVNVVITGSIAFDYLMSFPGRFRDHLLADQLDRVSVSFLVDSMRRQRGGIAPNIAYTMALLGGRPRVMATAGRDFEGYQRWLEERGVDTSAVVIYPDDYCASFFVSTDLDQNQIASFYQGAMAHAADLRFADLTPRADLAVISPNAPGAMVAYVEECKKSGIAYVYDPSQQIIRLSGEELLAGIQGCMLLTANEYEVRMIGEKTGLNEGQIRSRAQNTIITRGKDGATIFAGDKTYDIPAFPPARVADPTGAGDAFRGGLLRGLQLGLSWELCGRMGALASTYVLESYGTQGHHFTLPEFIARLRLGYDDQGALDVLLGPDSLSSDLTRPAVQDRN